MRVGVYVVVHISTDDCTYHCSDYCDTFGSEKEAKEYIGNLCKKTKGGWTTHQKEDFEIRTKILDITEEDD